MSLTVNERLRDIFFTLQGKRLRFSLWLASATDLIFDEQWRAVFSKPVAVQDFATLSQAPTLARALIRQNLESAAAAFWLEGFNRSAAAIPDPVGTHFIVPELTGLPAPTVPVPIQENEEGDEDRVFDQDDMRAKRPPSIAFPAAPLKPWAISIYRPPSPREIEEVVNVTGWGANLQELVDGDRIMNEIVSGVANGSSNAQIASAIRPLVNKSRTRARRIARTESHRLAQRMIERSIDDSIGPAVKAFRYVATLDRRTRHNHADRDSKEFPVDQPRPRLPDGFNCRCTYTPITASFSDLGVPELEGLLSDAERASMDGSVPRATTYPLWFDGQPASVQAEIVGPRRFAMLSARSRQPDGRIKWSAFAAAPNSPAKAPPLRTQRGTAPARL